jgi:hypothetical protein
MSPSQELEKELERFTGTTRYYRAPFTALLYTDGIQYLAEQAGAYWLIDLIASYQRRCQRDEMLRDFQFWYLTRPDSAALPWLQGNPKGGCIVSCWCDTPIEGTAPNIRQTVPYTDFPLSEIRLYVSGGVLFLPSEN